MGPQLGGGLPLDDPARPPRAAAGRDIKRPTLREPQVGHSTSASSDRRRMRVSKAVSQPRQEYS
jgi:hypothetical protein